MSYPSYPEMKDSDVEWLGRVPKHWEVKRMRFVCEINPSKAEIFGLPADHPVSFLPMEKVGTEGEMILDEARSIGDVLQGFTYFRDQDVIVAKITPCFENGKGALCQNLINGVGFGSTEFHVLRPHPGHDPKFIFYLAKSELFRSLGEALMIGSAGQKRIPEEFVSNFVTSFPPLNEQQTIATFLDRKTAELDELIRLKERQIELLCVKRQALISHAVTRGLDPSVKLRPSGIEWLGEIPAHWELLRLKFCLCSIEQGWSPSCENRMAEPDEWGVLKVGCVNGTSFNQSENKALPSNLEPLIEYEIKGGDMLMSRANTRELLGSASVVENVRPRLLLCDKLYRLNLKAEVLNNYFLVFYLGGSVARHQIERDATGASGVLSAKRT